MRPPESVFWRRRAEAVAVLAALGTLLVVGVRGCGDDDGGRGATGGGAGGGRTTAEGRPPAPPELPRGGRRIFPDHRVVALYGAPQDDELGALGIGSPDDAGRRLRRLARGYRRPGRPVLPAMELITTIAAAAPGEGGLHRIRQEPEVVARYLAAARRHDALLVLDVQPGRASFADEVAPLERWLRKPDVGLALDPEWHVGPGEVPGQVLGSVDAEDVNAVAARLSALVRRHRLPEKLLIVHRFTLDMLRRPERLRSFPGVALVLNADGFGSPELKVARYAELTRGLGRRRHGFKLFFREDDPRVMAPREVLRLRPAPDVVVYE